jgi:hypothetical protein
LQTQKFKENENETSKMLVQTQVVKVADNAKQFEEKRTFGAMNWKTYFNYFRVGGGVFGCSLNFIVFALCQVLIVLADYWVSNW